MDNQLNKWNQIKTNTFLKQTHFDNILQFCLESSYCIFNNEFYKQTFGLLMGSPLSATAANVVMEELEKIFFLNYLMISYFITDM